MVPADVGELPPIANARSHAKLPFQDVSLVIDLDSGKCCYFSLPNKLSRTFPDVLISG